MPSSSARAAETAATSAPRSLGSAGTAGAAGAAFLRSVRRQTALIRQQRATMQMSPKNTVPMPIRQTNALE